MIMDIDSRFWLLEFIIRENMKETLRLPSKKVCLTVSQLPHDLTPQEAQQLAAAASSYLLIPGHPLSTVLDIEELITALLPLSHDQLIDIGLPFPHPSRALRLQARYILFGGKLTAIRICQCPEWTWGKVQQISPSPALQQHYRLHKIPFTPHQILVGCFYLQLDNCRIGLLFEEQLQADSALLKLYDRYKCDILSVSSCPQRSTVREENTFRNVSKEREGLMKLESMVREQGIVLVFGGIKVVPSLSNVFWDNSFIMQGSKCLNQPRALIGDRNIVSLVADLGQGFIRKWNSQPEEDETEGEDELWLEKKELPGWLKSQQHSAHQEVSYPQGKKILSDLVTQKEVTLYNLHYLFRTVNQVSPFVLPYPLSSKTQQLLTHLLLLQQHSRTELHELISIYSTVSEYPASTHQVVIHSSFTSMLSSNEHIRETVYLYCDDPSELKKLREQFGAKICNCDALNPFCNDPSKTHPNSHGLQLKKIESACVHVLRGRFQNIEDMLAYFLAIGLNKNQIEKCFAEVLPAKVKTFLKLSPHYLYLLHSDRDKILEAVGEAEVRLRSQGREGSGDERVESLEEVNRLAEKIETARAFKHRVEQYLVCHRCQIGFKKDLTHWCPHCQKVLCLDCLDTLTNHSLFDLSNYKCAICSGKCSCRVCHPISQSRLPSALQESSPAVYDDPVFNPKVFECLHCQILGDNYDLIRLECSQCQQLKCYNCARMSNLVKDKMDEWICEECTQFNWQINHPPQMRPEKEGRNVIQIMEVKEEPKLSPIHFNGNSPGSSETPLRNKKPRKSRSRSVSKSCSRSRSIDLNRRTVFTPKKNLNKDSSSSKGTPLWKKGKETHREKWKKHRMGKSGDRPAKASSFNPPKASSFNSAKPSFFNSDQNKATPSSKPEVGGLIFETKEIAEPESFSY